MGQVTYPAFVSPTDGSGASQNLAFASTGQTLVSRVPEHKGSWREPRSVHKIKSIISNGPLASHRQRRLGPNRERREPPSARPPLYGDGRAGERVVRALTLLADD